MGKDKDKAVDGIVDSVVVGVVVGYSSNPESHVTQSGSNKFAKLNREHPLLTTEPLADFSHQASVFMCYLFTFYSVAEFSFEISFTFSSQMYFSASSLV